MAVQSIGLGASRWRSRTMKARFAVIATVVCGGSSLVIRHVTWVSRAVVGEAAAATATAKTVSAFDDDPLT